MAKILKSLVGSGFCSRLSAGKTLNQLLIKLFVKISRARKSLQLIFHKWKFCSFLRQRIFQLAVKMSMQTSPVGGKIDSELSLKSIWSNRANFQSPRFRQNFFAAFHRLRKLCHIAIFQTNPKPRRKKVKPTRALFLHPSDSVLMLSDVRGFYLATWFGEFNWTTVQGAPKLTRLSLSHDEWYKKERKYLKIEKL